MPLRCSSLIYKSNPAPLWGEIYEPTFIPVGFALQGKHCALIDQLGWWQKRAASALLDVGDQGGGGPVRGFPP